MKKIKLAFSICLLSISLAFVSSQENVKADSYYLYGNNLKNYNGITYKKYWPGNNTTSWQKQRMNDVFYRWNSSEGSNIITPMNVNLTWNRNESIIDFSYSRTWWDGSQRRTGETTFWNWGNKVNYSNGMPFKQWSSALTQFGGYAYINSSNLIKERTLAHEIGHAVGIAHNGSTRDSIMYPSIDLINGNRVGPNYGDLLALNALY